MAASAIIIITTESSVINIRECKKRKITNKLFLKKNCPPVSPELVSFSPPNPPEGGGGKKKKKRPTSFNPIKATIAVTPAMVPANAQGKKYGWTLKNSKRSKTCGQRVAGFDSIPPASGPTVVPTLHSSGVYAYASAMLVESVIFFFNTPIVKKTFFFFHTSFSDKKIEREKKNTVHTSAMTVFDTPSVLSSNRRKKKKKVSRKYIH